MKHFTDVFLTLAIIATFLFLGTATSYEDDFLPELDHTFLLVNASDSCQINCLSFVFSYGQNQMDTIEDTHFVPPLDTTTIVMQNLSYTKLRYSCMCPDSVFTAFETDIPKDSLLFHQLLLDCQ